MVKIIMLLVLSIYGLVFSQEARDILDFAEYLYEGKDYYRAGVEFERALYLHGEDDRIALKAGLCYFHREKFKRSLFHLKKINGNSPVYEEALKYRSLSFLRLKRYEACLSLLSNNESAFSSYVKGYCHYRERNSRKSRECFNRVSRDGGGGEYKNREVIIDLLYNREHFREKKYSKAFIFSLIPGVGHFYCDRPSDGIYSFAVVGFMSLLSAFYYGQNNETMGALCAGGAGFFYLGSIYGALVGVKWYNQLEYEKYDKKMDFYFYQDIYPPFRDQ